MKTANARISSVKLSIAQAVLLVIGFSLLKMEAPIASSIALGMTILLLFFLDFKTFEFEKSEKFGTSLVTALCIFVMSVASLCLLYFPIRIVIYNSMPKIFGMGMVDLISYLCVSLFGGIVVGLIGR